MAEETITAQTPEIDPGMSVMPEGPGLMDVPTVIPELGLAAQALASQVSFAKKTWKDGSGGGTPITAAELNRLEQGVVDLTTAVNALRDSVSMLWSGETMTFEIETYRTVAEVSIGTFGQPIGLFFAWLSTDTVNTSKLPTGVTVSNVGRTVTVTCADSMTFIVRKYVC